MKYYFFLLMLFFFAAAGCHKDGDAATNTEVTLYDKTPDQILSILKGKWAVVKIKGGFAANIETYYTDLFWEFNTDNKFRATYQGIVKADTAMFWHKERGGYVASDSTYTSKIFYKNGVPLVYVFNKILNDTLRMSDFAADAQFYFLTRVK